MNGQCKTENAGPNDRGGNAGPENAGMTWMKNAG